MSNNENIVDFIKKQLVATEYYFNEDMKKHTTFKTGGTADLMVVPHNIHELCLLMRHIIKEKIPYVVIGHGSNILVGDKGIREVVIKIDKNLNNIAIKGDIADVEAGALLADVSKEVQKNGLSGLEFACGIPGTVGGAVVMNAGAYGREMKDVAEEAVVLTKAGELLTLKGSDLEFGYRTSSIQTKGDLVLKVKLRLQKGDRDEIQKTMDELVMKREQSQPLEYPSAGSTFKRPQGYFTGKLIQEANLSGYQLGGAQVSKKHAGFVINVGNATTGDILNLIGHIQKEVKRLFGVELETEVRVIGEL